MSALTDELRLMGGNVQEQAARLRRTVQHTMPGPLLVRIIVFACGAAALAVAYGPVVSGPYAVPALAVAALLPALLPRTQVPAWVLFVAAFGWLLSAAAYPPPVGALRLAALSVLLYLLHAAAALAAMLPYDTVVPPRVLARWFARAGGVVVASTLFAFVLALLGARVGSRTYLAASLAGLAAAVALAVVLARARRAGDGHGRPGDSGDSGDPG